MGRFITIPQKRYCSLCGNRISKKLMDSRRLYCRELCRTKARAYRRRLRRRTEISEAHLRRRYGLGGKGMTKAALLDYLEELHGSVPATVDPSTEAVVEADLGTTGDVDLDRELHKKMFYRPPTTDPWTKKDGTDTDPNE